MNESDKKLSAEFDKLWGTVPINLPHIAKVFNQEKEKIKSFLLKAVSQAREEEAKSCQEALTLMNKTYNEDLKIFKAEERKRVVGLLRMEEKPYLDGKFISDEAHGYNQAVSELNQKLNELERE